MGTIFIFKARWQIKTHLLDTGSTRYGLIVFTFVGLRLKTFHMKLGLYKDTKVKEPDFL